MRKVIFACACLVFLVFSVPRPAAQCGSGTLQSKSVSCCGGGLVSSLVCMGTQSSNCDPLGGNQRACGGGCYIVGAGTCLSAPSLAFKPKTEEPLIRESALWGLNFPSPVNQSACTLRDAKFASRFEAALKSRKHA